MCDACNQGHHTACFGMQAVPEANPWLCAGCTVLRQLAVGQHIVTETPQNLYQVGVAEPHLTQALYLSSISSLGPLQRDGSGCNRQVHVVSSNAPLPGSVRYYSNSHPHARLQRVPRLSTERVALLLQQTGVSKSSMTLASSRHGMFGTAAAACGLSSEAWLAGPDCGAEALRILAGPPKQAFLICGGGSSNSSSPQSAVSGAAVSRQQQGPHAPAVTQPQLLSQAAQPDAPPQTSHNPAGPSTNPAPPAAGTLFGPAPLHSSGQHPEPPLLQAQTLHATGPPAYQYHLHQGMVLPGPGPYPYPLLAPPGNAVGGAWGLPYPPMLAAAPPPGSMLPGPYPPVMQQQQHAGACRHPTSPGGPGGGQATRCQPSPVCQSTRLQHHQHQQQRRRRGAVSSAAAEAAGSSKGQ